jgi:glycosyltransferase involved in cell wall biosynthesis
MATDIVALPFELVPADAPLSILEAQALGKPIVTTRVASLPEMAAAGVSYLAEPADPVSLAQALLEAAVDLGRQQSEDSLAVAREPLDSLAVACRPLDSLAVACRPLEPPEQDKRMIRSWRKVGEEWSQLVQAL